MRLRSACLSLAAAMGMTVRAAGTADATGLLSGTEIRAWQSGHLLGIAGNSTIGGAPIQ